ncbi:Hsp20-family heat shock protein associated with gas vesicle synthesis [Octadecabacter antarcticus 307]|uniref:Hsp20-family heat shock protein associated with gas vesicle synthesis n=1 Tax=Octadecabacter antarcticus 307 TaxID=391626 RepID=M9R7G0_9RHOB|nr:Hsp20/alpha crystallin family protein [Octadecabacter antarcticus]AGI68579.1 Hsp20-family heat shock protein associated with gas vesicle synthesis [Octadecabacter antarcticus 307]
MKKKTTGKSKAEKNTPEIELGGLFRGLGDFVNLLSKLAETGEKIKESEGEFQIKGLGDNTRGIYGFSVRSGIGGGGPRVQAFGNVRTSEAGLVVDEVREPMVDVFDEGSEIVITVELPGVLESEIVTSVDDDVLIITTNGDRSYAKEIFLSESVLKKSLSQSYNYGLLEIRVKKMTHETGSGENDR